MDIENTNGCHMLGDGLTETTAASTPSPNSLDDHFKMDLKPISNEHVHQQSHSGFIFGNGDNGNLNGGTTITKTSNGGGSGGSHGPLLMDGFSGHSAHDNDFGPETDVDATDDAAISPLSSGSHSNDNIVNVSELNAENIVGKYTGNGNEYDFIEKSNENLLASNPFGSSEHVLKKDNVEFNDEHEPFGISNNNNHHHYEDNRFLDESIPISRDHYGAADGDEDDFDHQQQIRNKIDFSEKKEYSFEREDYEKELDPIGDIPAELIAITKEVAVAADDNEKEAAAITDSTENIIESPMGEIITTEQHGKYKLQKLMSSNVFAIFYFTRIVSRREERY